MSHVCQNGIKTLDCEEDMPTGYMSLSKACLATPQCLDTMPFDTL